VMFTQRAKGWLVISIATCILLAGGHFLCCSRPAQPTREVYRFTEILMGTVVEISIYGATEDNAQSAAMSAFGEMKRLERVFNPYDPTSELYALNASAHEKPFAASNELCRIVKRAVEVCKASKRAFDPTFFALGIDFKDGVASIPDEDEIARRLKRVDCNEVMIGPKTCQVSFELEGMKLGLGGIAKGFIVDEAAQNLKNNGIKDFIVNAGGDMIVSGAKGNNPWRIGIENPLKPNQTFAVLEPKGRAIATSGNYRRFGEKKGKAWGHIIDPRTGRAATQSLSATACANDLTTADAWATALFVLGTEGVELAETINGIDALVVSKDKQILKTKGFDACAGLISIEPLK